MDYRFRRVFEIPDSWSRDRDIHVGLDFRRVVRTVADAKLVESPSLLRPPIDRSRNKWCRSAEYLVCYDE